LQGNPFGILRICDEINHFSGQTDQKAVSYIHKAANKGEAADLERLAIPVAGIALSAPRKIRPVAVFLPIGKATAVRSYPSRKRTVPKSQLP
jgi:hypothetical protein